MAARTPDVLAMREHRETFQLAIRAGITMDEARRRRAAERWAAIDAQRVPQRCGTMAVPVASGEDEDEGRPLAWWQR